MNALPSAAGRAGPGINHAQQGSTLNIEQAISCGLASILHEFKPKPIPFWLRMAIGCG